MTFRLSRSFESSQSENESNAEQEHIEEVGRSLEAEIERVINEGLKLGEGKTAHVFSVSSSRLPMPVCMKIWKPDVIKLKDKNIVDYRRMQYSSPEEEFDLQDSLYMKGFRKIPRPLAFETVKDYQVLAMEELPGYTLQEIEAAGATIEEPSRESLNRLLFDLTITNHVVHRDLGKQNIFLKTTDQLSSGGSLRGEIYFIDFGLSKKIYSDPSPEDFNLTIGRDMIKYPNDRSNVDSLKPRPGKSGIFAH